MMRLYDKGVYLIDGKELLPEEELHKSVLENWKFNKAQAHKGTITYSILKEHNTSGDMHDLKLKFDSITSHDLTYVGIIQTAKASGMETFPLPYILTNCHNSLCAVGGTINGDDHLFGLSACKRYGGIYVPPHIAVIHQYIREMMAGCGKMILGSDSHTRYGALGTLAIGEGGGELVKQLLQDTYDIKYPEVIAVYLDGKVRPGVGPHDVALAIVGKVFKNGYVKNKIMEFVGPGIKSMPTDFRNSIDVMTTETTCLSSIWQTDHDTGKYLHEHGRANEYRELKPAKITYYEGAIYIDLSTINPMIALPFHPSNVYELEDVVHHAGDILREVEREAARITGRSEQDFHITDKLVDGKLRATQGIIAGCAGGNYINVMEAVNIIRGKTFGNEIFSLSVYPSSQPVYIDLIRKGAIDNMLLSGGIVKTAFCGPCFGAGDTPSNNGFSIRHTTRNFPNREGSKPGMGQMAAVALMDARSIAATAVNGGILTSATDLATDDEVPEYQFEDKIYKSRVYQGFARQDNTEKLIYGPNIKDWPEMSVLGEHIVVQICSIILDPVTTTDELIPSGETASYRSNPIGLAEYTLSRRDPEYVERAKKVDKIEKARVSGEDITIGEEGIEQILEKIHSISGWEEVSMDNTEFGSAIYAIKPGDGSAREQAASCQRVIGGLANFCKEYATKRYRSNVINWGMIPFQMDGEPEFQVGAYIFIPEIRKALDLEKKEIKAYILENEIKELSLYIADLSSKEKEIIKAGSLINYNRK